MSICNMGVPKFSCYRDTSGKDMLNACKGYCIVYTNKTYIHSATPVSNMLHWCTFRCQLPYLSFLNIFFTRTRISILVIIINNDR